MFKPIKTFEDAELLQNDLNYQTNLLILDILSINFNKC